MSGLVDAATSGDSNFADLQSRDMIMLAVVMDDLDVRSILDCDSGRLIRLRHVNAGFDWPTRIVHPRNLLNWRLRHSDIRNHRIDVRMIPTHVGIVSLR